MRFDLDTLLGLFFFVVFIVLPLVTRSRSKQQPRGGPGAPQQGVPGRGAPQRGASNPGTTGQGGTSASGRPSGMPSTLGRPSSGAGGAQGGASSTLGRPSDSPLAMLEEIRRRVQEAQERERAAGRSAGGSGSATQASSSTPSRPATTAASAASTRPVSPAGRSGRPLVASDPFERGLVARAEQRPTPPATLGREGTARSDTPRRASAPPQLARSRSVIEGADAPASRRKASARAAARRADEGLGARLGALGLDRMDRSTILHGLIWHEILDEPAVYRRLRRQRSRPL